jgi:hypothetical protein
MESSMYGSIRTTASVLVTLAITTGASAQCPPRCIAAAPRVVQKPMQMPSPPSNPPSAYTPSNSSLSPQVYPSAPSQSVYTSPSQAPSYYPPGPQAYPSAPSQPVYTPLPQSPSLPAPPPPSPPGTYSYIPTAVCIVPALGSCTVAGQASSGDACWCPSIYGPVSGNIQ